MIKEEIFVDNITALRYVKEMLDFNERVTMNLFYLILSDSKAYVWSDHKNFIICQSNDQMPMWVWLADDIDTDATECVTDIIAARVLLNSNIQINISADAGKQVLRIACEKSGANLEKVMDLNAYVCKNVIEPEYDGVCVVPQKSDREAMVALINEFVEDAEHQIITNEEAEGFADSMIGSHNLSLWKCNDEVCAMAMIAHKTNEIARINSVVTLREKRGNGYAGMLISKICKALIEDNIIPMLYADADNPSSNRAYQKIGFEKVGKVTQYKFDRKAI